jgi:hypothetical protein
MLEIPRFIQGVFAFEGRGLERPEPLQPLARHTVARDRRAQLIYFRGGNSSPELIYLVLRQNERPIRYFPLGAKAGAHIPLAIVEDIAPEAQLDVLVAAPEGVRGSLLLDIGLMEI